MITYINFIIGVFYSQCPNLATFLTKIINIKKFTKQKKGKKSPVSQLFTFYSFYWRFLLSYMLL